jgi:ribosomal protein L25 (general stress protein Ctc)
LYNSNKEVKLDAINLFKIVLKEDIIKLDIKDFFSNNKQYKIIIKEYKQNLLNKDITKYIFIILFSLLILILRLLALRIS